MTATIPNVNSPSHAVQLEMTQAPSLPQTTSLMTEFGVARTHREVLASWRLVHDCYTQKGLIASNPYGLHTTAQALNRKTAVVIGRTNGKIDSTLSIIPDSARGLPLDQVYPQVLDHLRTRRTLCEVGLLADARQNVSRDLSQSFGAMRYAFYCALHNQADIVIGVHPRHAEFYVRMMGFEIIGQMSSHPKVRNRPVVPLMLDTSRIRLEPLPRMLRYFKSNPIEPAAYDCCFRFGAATMARSPIASFINYNATAEKFRQFETLSSRMPIQQVGNL